MFGRQGVVRIMAGGLYRWVQNNPMEPARGPDRKSVV